MAETSDQNQPTILIKNIDRSRNDLRIVLFGHTGAGRQYSFLVSDSLTLLDCHSPQQVKSWHRVQKQSHWDGGPDGYIRLKVHYIYEDPWLALGSTPLWRLDHSIFVHRRHIKSLYSSVPNCSGCPLRYLFSHLLFLIHFPSFVFF